MSNSISGESNACESNFSGNLANALYDFPAQPFLQQTHLSADELLAKLTILIEIAPWGGPLGVGESRYIPTTGFRLARLFKNSLVEAGQEPDVEAIFGLEEVVFAFFRAKKASYCDPYEALYRGTDFESEGDLFDEIIACWDRVSLTDPWTEAVANATNGVYTFLTGLCLTDKVRRTLAIAYELDAITGGDMYICVEKLGESLGAKGKGSAASQGRRALDCLEARGLLRLEKNYKPGQICRRCEFRAHGHIRKM